MAIPRYFPFMHGMYDVKAGISALGRDFGHGALDRQVFQRDEQFTAYRAAKLAAADKHEQHILRDGLATRIEQAIAHWMTKRLRLEDPARGAGLPAEPQRLNELALQVQEDLAVLVLDEQGRNRLAYLNVAMPSGWAPEEKIGKPFSAVHAPVPHIEAINAKQDSIARLMVNATRGAVRFAWTITPDAALNHHPLREQNPATPAPSPLPDHRPGEPLLRVERQVIWGFPEHQAALFTIRTYLYPLEALDPTTRAALASAVDGMSDASLRYKNMDRDRIRARLTQLDA